MTTSYKDEDIDMQTDYQEKMEEPPVMEAGKNEAQVVKTGGQSHGQGVSQTSEKCKQAHLGIGKGYQELGWSGRFLVQSL
jgi:hypothetical protein